MGVTPLTDGLPWWATQQGSAGPPGPTGGPAATPQGGGQDWLAYLQQMLGISPAQAEGLMSAQGGAQQDQRQQQIPTVGAKDFMIPPGPEQTPPGPNVGPGPGNVGPVTGFLPYVPGGGAARGPLQPQQTPYDPLSSIRPPPAQPAPAPVSSSVNPYSGPLAAADAAHAPTGGAYSHMPFPGQRDSQGFWGPLPSAGPMAAGGPVGGGGASGVGATSNPRFVQDYRPNRMAEGGGGQGAGRGGPPLMSMLDLSGMFGPLARRRS